MKFAIFGNKHQIKKSKSIEELFNAIVRHDDTFSIDRSYYEFLHDEGLCIPEPEELIEGNDFSADMAISFGGDGTLLRTASHV